MIATDQPIWNYKEQGVNNSNKTTCTNISSLNFLLNFIDHKAIFASFKETDGFLSENKYFKQKKSQCTSRILLIGL